MCKLAYEYLEEHGYLYTIRDEIDEPDKIRQLTSLRYWQGGDIFRFQPMILRKNMMKTEIRYGIAAA